MLSASYALPLEWRSQPSGLMGDHNGPLRLTSVMSRIRIDLTPLLDEDGQFTLHSAAVVCGNCQKPEICDRWIDRNSEGVANAAPAFCPAMSLLGNAEVD